MSSSFFVCITKRLYCFHYKRREDTCVGRRIYGIEEVNEENEKKREQLENFYESHDI